jgi:hypothetical protein
VDTELGLHHVCITYALVPEVVIKIVTPTYKALFDCDDFAATLELVPFVRSIQESG